MAHKSGSFLSVCFPTIPETLDFAGQGGLYIRRGADEVHVLDYGEKGGGRCVRSVGAELVEACRCGARISGVNGWGEEVNNAPGRTTNEEMCQRHLKRLAIVIDEFVLMV